MNKFRNVENGKEILAVRLSINNYPEVINEIIKYASYVELQLVGGKASITFEQYCTGMTLEIRDGDYLIKSDVEVPNVMPTAYYFGVLDWHQFSMNFIPVDVTEVS